MNTYREFTIRQQVIFYTVTLLVAGACIYLDFTHEEANPGVGQQTEAIKKPAKQIFSGNEVAHSGFTFVEFK